MISKVLLVDDVSMFLELQKGYLRYSSIRIITAKSGDEALAVARRERPALIFMDLHMPGMRGDACCAAIKADPELRAIPVIMITAEGKEDDRRLCVAAGCDGFLTKPLDRLLYLQTARSFLPSIDRRDTRKPCRCRVRFRVFGVVLSGESRDVSANGLYLATDYEVSVGTGIEVEFILPDRPEEVLRCKGRVAWTNGLVDKKKYDLPSGFGIELLNPPASVQARLREFAEA